MSDFLTSSVTDPLHPPEPFGLVSGNGRIGATAEALGPLEITEVRAG
jgi:hypothetical protein